MSGAFEGERALVVGAGIAGASAARVLVAEGAHVLVTDQREAADLGETVPGLLAAGAEFRDGVDAADLGDTTLVVVSPGVSPSSPIVRAARSRGLPVWGEMELGARLASVPYLAVTGTNGKTTTTGMIASCLAAAGMDAAACGNIGRPFPETARERHDVLVVEVSSFQLAVQESFHPKVSVLLNLAPDHLDWHGGESAYREAKARIYAQQGPGDIHVGNRDDPAAARLTEAAPCDVVWFRSGTPASGEVGYEKDQLVARRDDGRDGLGAIGGTRAGYREDAAAAAAAALAFGAEPAAVRRGLADFRPAPHRGEEVARIDGVMFLDNSKATNVHAVLAALATAPKGAVLIAGGRAKGQDLAPLRSAAGALAGVVVIGESADELAVVFEGAVPVRRADTLEGAVATAFELASHPGTVLLAPACASWDMFRDYAERGDVFAAAARALGRAHAGS